MGERVDGMDAGVLSALPDLPGPYGDALLEACCHALDSYDAQALVVGGSILRGEGHATSDFDIVLIHGASWRQRTQYWAKGVPVELFVNPVSALRTAMQHEVVTGRQTMIHLFRTGIIALDRDGDAARLRNEAEALFIAGPQVPAATVRQRQYAVACLLDDAIDLREIDPERSRSLVGQALDGAAELFFLRSGRWQPRLKMLYNALERDDPAMGTELRAVLQGWTTADVADIETRARLLLEALSGVRGFFAWESKPEDVGL